MRTADVLRFSVRALAGHRLRAGLSVLGVTIGVSSVLVLTSLGEGARLYVMNEFSALGSNLVIVVPGKTETTGMAPLVSEAPHDLSLADADAIARRVPGVTRVAPLVFGTAKGRAGVRTRDVTVAGLTWEMKAVRRFTMASGTFLPQVPPDRVGRLCVVGPKLARELFPDRSPLGETLLLGDERFRVIGVLSPRGVSMGMDFDEIVQIPVTHAQRLFDRTGLFRLLVECRSHEAIPSVRDAVRRLLTERHGEEDITVLTQDAVRASFGRILSLLTAALGGIAGISLCVAGVGIMNVMLVSVSERTFEIGLLKAVGVSRGQVLAVFLAESALLSFAGGLLGLLAGFSAAAGARALWPSFPVQPPPWAVTAAVVVSVAVGLVFGALPARRAARLDPIEALGRR